MINSDIANTKELSLNNAHIKSLLVKAIEQIEQIYATSDADSLGQSR